MQPNILLIVVDSMRADHVSSYGYHRDTTPNFHRLADEGCLFETAITAAPFSPASYASIFSNLYPHQHGVNGDTVRVWPDAWPRLPELMKAQGYFTFCASNNSFVTPATNCARGFDWFMEIPRPVGLLRQYNRVIRRIRKHLGDGIANRLSTNRLDCLVKGDSVDTVRQIGRLFEQSDRPFFGFVILMDPHTPYNKCRTEYCGRIPSVRRFLRHRNERTMWAELMAANGRLTDVENGIVRDLYDAEIRHADACVGSLVTSLREKKLLDDTIVAVTSDHGEAFGEHGVWGHGFCLKDCLTRVPLVLRHPRYWSPGTRFPGLVQLHDLHDLCVSVAASGQPRVDDNPNCLTQASDLAWPGRSLVFSEFPRQSKTLRFMHDANPDFSPGVWDLNMWAVRSADWRFIEYSSGEAELYDLRRDPGETTSVHSEHPSVCERLRASLESHRDNVAQVSATTQLPQELEDSVTERLRGLGYIE